MEFLAIVVAECPLGAFDGFIVCEVGRFAHEVLDERPPLVIEFGVHVRNLTCEDALFWADLALVSHHRVPVSAVFGLCGV